jgi:hypothetical protein
LAASVALFAWFPRAAIGPEPAYWQWYWSLPEVASQSTSPAMGLSRPEPVVVTSLSTMPARAPSKRRAVPDRPARYIDDAVRQRALRAVHDALARQDGMS